MAYSQSVNGMPRMRMSIDEGKIQKKIWEVLLRMLFEHREERHIIGLRKESATAFKQGM